MDEPQEPFTPAPQFEGHYRRPSDVQGSAAKLQALADGYFGLNMVFLVNVILALAFNIVPRLLPSPQAATIALLLGIPAMGLLIGFLTYPKNLRIAEGKGWQASKATLASVLMGLNSALCCGIIGYVVMQQIAYKEMMLYGVKPRFMGVRKRDLDRAINELRESEARLPSAQNPL